MLTAASAQESSSTSGGRPSLATIWHPHTRIACPGYRQSTVHVYYESTILLAATPGPSCAPLPPRSSSGTQRTVAILLLFCCAAGPLLIGRTGTLSTVVAIIMVSSPGSEAADLRVAVPHPCLIL